jgi:hypothetical protein
MTVRSLARFRFKIRFKPECWKVPIGPSYSNPVLQPQTGPATGTLPGRVYTRISELDSETIPGIPVGSRAFRQNGADNNSGAANCFFEFGDQFIHAAILSDGVSQQAQPAALRN